MLRDRYKRTERNSGSRDEASRLLTLCYPQRENSLSHYLAFWRIHRMFIALHKERDHVVVVGRPLRFNIGVGLLSVVGFGQCTPLFGSTRLGAFWGQLSAEDLHHVPLAGEKCSLLPRKRSIWSCLLVRPWHTLTQVSNSQILISITLRTTISITLVMRDTSW